MNEHESPVEDFRRQSVTEPCNGEPAQRPSSNDAQATPQPRVVAQFFHYNSDGTPFARVDRWQPGFRPGKTKDFLPYLALPEGGFATKAGLNGKALPLYRLPELLAAGKAGHDGFGVEGQRKADRLGTAFREGGLVAAVTSFGSSSMRLTDEQIAAFKGIPHVPVLADSDATGRVAARENAERIARAYPECIVKVVDFFPDRDDSRDIEDWLDEGHSLQELHALIEVAERVQARKLDVERTGLERAVGDKKLSNGKTGERPSFVRVGDFLAESDGDDIEWVVDGLLPIGGTSVFAGRPKGGKSTTALTLALAVSRGDTFLGRAVRKGPVLYLALEGAEGVWRAALRQMGAADDDVHICVTRAPEQALAWLRDEIERVNPVLVLIDTMQRMLRVKDGNDYATGSNSTDAVIELARTVNAHLMLLHHSGKTRHAAIVDEVMGSTAYAGSVDTVLVLRRTERFRTIASEQRIGEPLPETVLEMNAETHLVSAAGTKTDADLAEMRKAVRHYLREYAEAHRATPTVDEATILECVEGRKQTKQIALRASVDSGEITRFGTGKKGDAYRYADSASLPPNYSQEGEKAVCKNAENPHRVRPDATSQPFDFGEDFGSPNPLREGDRSSRRTFTVSCP